MLSLPNCRKPSNAARSLPYSRMFEIDRLGTEIERRERKLDILVNNAVGYLHTVAVDGQIWTGMDRGSFEKQGLDLELRQFNTGLEIFQALIGGSLDVLATGAVLSNFPARTGQGVPDQRHRGRYRSTLGALRPGYQVIRRPQGQANRHCDRHYRPRVPRQGPARQQDRPEGSGTCQSDHAGGGDGLHLGSRPGCGPLGTVQRDGSRQDAGGYETRRRLGLLSASRNHRRLGRGKRLLRAEQGDARQAYQRLGGGQWDYIIANSNEAMEKLQKNHYSQTPLADINKSFKAQKMFTSRDWKRLYSDSTVTNWLQQSTDFFMANAGSRTLRRPANISIQSLSQDDRLRSRYCQPRTLTALPSVFFSP